MSAIQPTSTWSANGGWSLRAKKKETQELGSSWIAAHFNSSKQNDLFLADTWPETLCREALSWPNRRLQMNYGH